MKSIRMILLGFLYSLLFIPSVFAQQTPKAINLDVPMLVQQTPQWCWLSAAEMAIKYRNPYSTIRQCQILEQGYRLPPGTCCGGNEMNCVIPARDMSQIRFALAAFGGVFSAWTFPQDPMQLYASLKNDIPIIAQVRTGMNSTHAIVLRGMKFQKRVIAYGPQGPIFNIVPIVVINDPMIGETPVELSYGELRQSWIDSLAVLPSVETKPPPVVAKDEDKTPPGDDKDQGTPDANDSCGFYQRVIKSLPRMQSIKGAYDSRDGSTTYYKSRAQLPGRFRPCMISVDTSDQPTSYSMYCPVNVEKNDCVDTDEIIRSEYDRIKACYPNLEFEEKTGDRTYDVTFRAKSESGAVFRVRISQWATTSSDRCSGSISLFQDSE